MNRKVGPRWIYYLVPEKKHVFYTNFSKAAYQFLTKYALFCESQACLFLELVFVVYIYTTTLCAQTFMPMKVQRERRYKMLVRHAFPWTRPRVTDAVMCIPRTSKPSPFEMENRHPSNVRRSPCGRVPRLQSAPFATNQVR